MWSTIKPQYKVCHKNSRDFLRACQDSFNDLKVGAIRKLTPVTADGAVDDSRDSLFMGQTQLMSPDGPFPVTCMIEAKTLPEAIEKFPAAVEQEVERMVAEAQKSNQKEDSRIIVPGRGQ